MIEGTFIGGQVPYWWPKKLIEGTNGGIGGHTDVLKV